jgi:hypothetical protein
MNASPTPEVRYHTIRGIFAGIVLGLGVSLLLVLHGIVGVSSLAIVLLVGIAVGIAFGVVFARFAPPRASGGDRA